MGYSILYEPELNKKLKIPNQNRKFLLTVGTLAVCVIFVILCLLTPVRTVLRDFLIPGDPDVTQSAFSQMVSDIREGESFSDAVTVFCQEILEHASN